MTCKELGIEDPDGETQLKFLGIGPSNELQDEDGGADGFNLDNGILLHKADESDTSGYTRLTLGRNVGLGIRKSDTLASGGDGGTGEFIKNNPGGFTTIETDFDDSPLIFESKEGGGFQFKTSDTSTSDKNDELRRFFITDPASSDGPGAEVRFERLDGVGISTNQIRLYGKKAGAVGATDRVGMIVPEPGNDQLKVSSAPGNEMTFQPDGYTQVLRLASQRVTVGDAGQNTPGHMPPQDVRNVSSPQQGDMAFHDGSGPNTEGPAHYTSEGSWVSTVDGSTIS